MEVAWTLEDKGMESKIATLLIHGFGGCKEHWRNNQRVLSDINPCYAIDLIGFGESSQPYSKLRGEDINVDGFIYCFDTWGEQIADFCLNIIQKPVLLVGNSIGGVVALRAAQILQNNCTGIVLIDCAQRAMDDKRLDEQSSFMKYIRPFLKTIVKQRWLSSLLFKNAANPKVIKSILEQAYPSGNNINEELIKLLHKPSERENASEAFRGFINLFDDHLAPLLMENMTITVDMIWGDKDPWEPIDEAKKWIQNIECIRSLEVVHGAGHCPHDENPEKVNSLLLKIIQAAK